MRGARVAFPAAIAAAAAAVAAAPVVHALINPNFTPVDLVEQSELILLLEVGPLADGGPAGGSERVPARVVEAVKGNSPATLFELDLADAGEAAADDFREALGDGKRRALLFAGTLPEDYEVRELSRAAALHVGVKWFALSPGEAGGWRAAEDERNMAWVWAGSTEMLLRAVKYIMTDPDRECPARAGVAWDETPVKVGEVAGEVTGAMPVDLEGDGRLALFVTSTGGDRLFRWDDEARGFVDLTARLGLGSSSTHAAWGDFDLDGRLDLASVRDGKLVLWYRREGGFEARAADAELPDAIVGLRACDWLLDGRCGLIAAWREGPVALVQGKPASFAVKQLGSATGASSAGEARPCLVADFDGDAVPDVLQPFSSDGFFYKGKPGGGLEPPASCGGPASGEGKAKGFTGDFDADGLLDVVLVGKSGPFIWHNLGGGKFHEVVGESGEADYHSKPGCVGGSACDINNDGRRDFVVFYEHMAPQVFFNRGFMCFGCSQMLDISEHEILPEAHSGQRAGVIADLDGDGAQDMALVLKGERDGEVRVIFRDTEDAPGLAARAVLAPGGTFAGPLTVTGWNGGRCLGAQSVSPGGPGAFFGRKEPGPIRLEWRFPGGERRAHTVVVEEGTALVALGPGGAAAAGSDEAPGSPTAETPVISGEAPAPDGTIAEADGATAEADRATRSPAVARRRAALAAGALLVLALALARVFVTAKRGRSREAPK